MRWIILSLLVLCSGCQSVAGLAESLNTREVTSCIYATGAIGPYAQARIVSATGGASLSMCLDRE